MTQIPDSLKKLRDEKAGPMFTGIVFKEGFDAACAELLPVIEKMRKAVIRSQEYAEAGCIEAFTTRGDKPSLSDCIEDALAAADKIMGKT